MKMKQNETLFTNYTNDLFILILLEFKKSTLCACWWWLEIHFTGWESLIIPLKYAVFSKFLL